MTFNLQGHFFRLFIFKVPFKTLLDPWLLRKLTLKLTFNWPQDHSAGRRENDFLFNKFFSTLLLKNIWGHSWNVSVHRWYFPETLDHTPIYFWWIPRKCLWLALGLGFVYWFGLVRPGAIGLAMPVCRTFSSLRAINATHNYNFAGTTKLFLSDSSPWCPERDRRLTTTISERPSKLQN